MSASDPYDVTQDHDGNVIPRADVAPGKEPRQIDRYRIERLLGSGGFGRVYLAHDEQLDRLVAVKVPNRELISRGMSAEAYLEEARTVARLDHTHIVPVFDVGSTADCPCFVVTKYVEGTDLSSHLKQHRLTTIESAQLIATVAEALHHAHKLGLVHRDVKPGNILMGRDGKPYVADFGLALREENVGTGPRWAGTPAYMSPEQARGEGHRVNGRSDIFSLGAVFYELLVGRPPFRGSSSTELLEQVINYEPRPIRQFDEKIPKELERICHKALAKRASERYSSAHDMAEDLRLYLAEQSLLASDTTPRASVQTAQDSHSVTPPPTSTSEIRSASATPVTGTTSSSGQLIKIVPKGLRAFDAHDADFFLELLPGPRDRHGLPDGLRFWKTRIEETDADETFSVGLVYGPSGCGKSSLIKAGLMPRLSQEVISVYVEATPEETESRLLRGLRKRCPALGDDLSLAEVLAALRRGQGIPIGKKVLIVLDQFEQWLHGAHETEPTELVQALRQCDGSRVQCLLLVRDDFWMAVTRFMRELEIRLSEGENSAAVDLFPMRHAEKVLAAFGRAFDALPPDTRDITPEQKEFLQQAVAGLAEEGKVICVRLALFAEMMKGRPWTAAALKEVGGTQGVGETFIEETFSAGTASPQHRYHQVAARAVLHALLPASGADIKGEMKSYAELMEASGYANRSQDFDELILILDSELRLITPTDPESSGADRDHDSRVRLDIRQKYFQLTHDYLVPSLREWLTRKQKETRRGRAELRLIELSTQWIARPEKRLLPSWWEWASLRVLTDQKNWNTPQRKMMTQAGRLFGLYSGLSLLGIVIAAWIGMFVAARVRDDQNARYAKALVESLSAANTADISDLIEETWAYQHWTVPILKELVAGEGSSKEQLHAYLVLIRDDPSRVDALLPYLLNAEADSISVTIQSLQPYASRAEQQLWDALEFGSIAERLRAAAALAAFDPTNERWSAFGDDVAGTLVAVPPSESSEWIEVLRPIQQHLVPSLEQRFQDRSSARDDQRPIAAAALAEYLQDEPERVSGLILLAGNHAEFLPLLRSLRNHRSVALDRMQSMLEQSPADGAEPDERDTLHKVQSNAVACLLELDGDDEVWPLLGQSKDPTLRSYVIDRYARLGADHNTITERIAAEPDAAVRYALILAMGNFDLDAMSSERRQQVVEQIATLYREAPEPGVHAAAAFVLRNWQQQEVLADIDIDLANEPPSARRHWFINSQGQSFAVLEGPVALPPPRQASVIEPAAGEVFHQFAIGMHEVTLAEFQRSRPEHEYDAQYTPDPSCPAPNVSWYDAVAYCNWLNELEDIPSEQWCYEPNDDGKYAAGMRIAEDYLTRTGYRLPTDTESQFACRAYASTEFGFGEPVELLDRYSWYLSNADSHSWPVGSKLPNAMGMFDMHGNAWEWCHSQAFPPEGEAAENYQDVIVSGEDFRVMRGGGFLDIPEYVRWTYRSDDLPGNPEGDVGFRIARTIK